MLCLYDIGSDTTINYYSYPQIQGASGPRLNQDGIMFIFLSVSLHSFFFAPFTSLLSQDPRRCMYYQYQRNRVILMRSKNNITTKLALMFCLLTGISSSLISPFLTRSFANMAGNKCEDLPFSRSSWKPEYFGQNKSVSDEG